MLREKSNFGHGANSGGMSTAQASIGGVTLYGTVDAGVGFKSFKNRVNGNKVEKVGMFGGVWSSNSIGFKATDAEHSFEGVDLSVLGDTWPRAKDVAIWAQTAEYLPPLSATSPPRD